MSTDRFTGKQIAQFLVTFGVALAVMTVTLLTLGVATGDVQAVSPATVGAEGEKFVSARLGGPNVEGLELLEIGQAEKRVAVQHLVVDEGERQLRVEGDEPQ